MPPKQRAPLSNLPNALNSPLRQNKRPRPDGKAIFDDVPAPPSKRQQLDFHRDNQQERENIPPNPQTPQKRKPVSGLDHRLGHGGRSEAADRERLHRQHLLIQKEQDKARDKELQRDKQKAQRSQKDAQQDEIAKWQRYYEKKFPDFVFFFENIPEDARRKCSKQVRQLGAREDRFFSRGLTHVITTRPLPNEVNTPIEDEQPQHQHNLRQAGTINPSLLDKRTKAIDEHAGHAKGKSVFDLALSRKAGINGSPDKPKDTLHRAKELGIKIWQLEKLQRVLRVMFDDDNEPEYIDDVNQQNARSALTRAPKKQPEPLHKLIKREEQSKNSAHDLATMLKTELIPLSGPYLLVRCMNERTKPLLVRQFPRVSDPTDGDWPQFRPVTQGKCPFIVEDKGKRAEKAAARAQRIQQQDAEKTQQEHRVTRANAAEAHFNEQAPRHEHKEIEAHVSHHVDQAQKLEPYDSTRSALTELTAQKQGPAPYTRATQHHDAAKPQEENQENQEPDEDEDATEDDPAVADEDATTDAGQTTPTEGDFSKPCYDPVGHSRQTSFDMMAPPAALPRPNPAIGRPGGEPLASGLQRSGATAAIRSTMGISSAAAQPGLKAGTTKDIHSLQRRVLDRYSTAGSGSTVGMSAPAVPPAAQVSQHSNQGLIESRRMIDIAGRARDENPRAAKMKAQEKIHEQHQPNSTLDQRAAAHASEQRREKERRAVKTKREPKPGYCENCRDKFDDFEEHTKSRKHRKFATNNNNWVELDKLLALLVRPQKQNIEDGSSDEDDVSSMTTEHHTRGYDRAHK